MSDVTDLPDDIDALKAIVWDMSAQVVARDAEIARRDAQLRHHALMIAKLKARLSKQLRDRFGSSAESLEQLELMLEDLEISHSAEAPASEPGPEPAQKDKPARKPLPDHLPRSDKVLEAGNACSDCGSKLKRVGEDVTEELEYIPGRFVVNRFIRPRMACSCCERFQQAPLPSRPIERGCPGPGLLAHVLVSKYADHLPLYRQSDIYAREGVDLGRSTMAGWVGQSVALMKPLAEAIGKHVRSGAAIHADDTHVPVLSPGNGKTKTGRIWTYVRDERPWGSDVPPAAYYRFSMDRKGIRPAEHPGDYSGFMHADAYAGFEELYRSGKITAFGGQSQCDCLSTLPCMALIRREFFDEAQSNGTSTAIEALARITQLYAVEAEARGKPPDERAAIRQAKARPAFEDLVRWLQSELLKISGKSDLAKAVRYALGRLPHLEVYLSNGHLEIDNNAAERGMRGMAIGRKNWMFAGSEGGGENAAIAYTLIETAKLNQTDPQAWLTNVLSRIADHPAKRVSDLAPWNFKN